MFNLVLCCSVINNAVAQSIFCAPLIHVWGKKSQPTKSKKVRNSLQIKENEYFDAALRRFKRACEKAGVLTELRRREFYEKPTQERKRKKAAAVKRHLKRVSREVSHRKRLY